MMHEIEQKIFVDSYCLTHEYELLLGEKKEEIVSFQFYNFKHDKEDKIVQKTYSEALRLARERARDGRYKNYHFLIFKV